jgi:hypothetical protein
MDLDDRIFAGNKSSELLADMDPEMKAKIERPEWPSKVVHRRFVDRRLKDIWDNYVCETAPTEICISEVIRTRTKIRMNLVHIYGPTVFNEALYDPYITLRNDVMPRFLASQLYGEMHARIAFSLRLPGADSLHVGPPLVADSPFARASLGDFPDSRKFELVEIIADNFLYGEFLIYLREHFCPENLLCIRRVLEYEEMYKAWQLSLGIMPVVASSTRITSFRSASGSASSSTGAGGGGAGDSTRSVGGTSSRMSFRVGKQLSFRVNTSASASLNRCPEDIDNAAWAIYRYFVAPGAAYEIALSIRQRKDIMIALARPERQMFDTLKATAYGFLATNFNSFKFTDDYTNLVKTFRQNFRHRPTNKTGKGGCLGF